MTEPEIQSQREEEHHLLVKLFERLTGQTYQKLLMIWCSLAFGFGFIYFILSFVPGHGPTIEMETSVLEHLVNSIYYSIITATSTGYGDIVPQGISKVLAALQSICALFVFAVFVTKLVSHRQDIALREIHRLTFEDIFHNTREDLFILRKDFDTIMQEAENTGTLSDRSWSTLTTSFMQAQTLIQEIPTFYDGGNAYYTIDSKREELLLEAVHRTLHRINLLFDLLSKKGIDWTAHGDCTTELTALMHVIEETAPLWRERSPYEEKREAFEDILELKKGVHELLTQTIK